MGEALALFRGSSRLEYRNQNLKLLRAVEGEVTRSSYRLLWVDDAALALLERSDSLLCRAVLVDPEGTTGVPVRELYVQDYHVDEELGFVSLTFVVGSFLRRFLDFDPRLTSWGPPDAVPPRTFLTPWRDDWPTVEGTSDEDGTDSTWKEAIDFLTTSWDFSDSVFLRPLGTGLDARDDGPTLPAVQDAETEISLASYNPHLASGTLHSKRLRIAQSGGYATIAQSQDTHIDRDGVITTRVRCHEPGDANIHITVEPDGQFSTYIPLTLQVEPNPATAGTGPRFLGAEWANCLDSLAEHLNGNTELHLTILGLLSRVFPDDPRILYHEGRILYDTGRLTEARRAFSRSRELRADAQTVAWDLFTALQREELQDARALLERLSLSNPEHFDELVRVSGEIPERAGIGIVDVVHKTLGDEKALRILHAIGANATTDTGIAKVAEAIASIDPLPAYTYVRGALEAGMGGERAREVLLTLADQTGEREGVEPFAEAYLRWSGQDPTILEGQVARFSRLVRPEIRQGLLLQNAEELFAQGVGRHVGLNLILQVVETAIDRAEFLVAEHALQLTFANLNRDDPDDDWYRVQAEEQRDRLQATLADLAPVLSGTEAYTERLLDELRLWLREKTVIVFGGRSKHDRADRWAEALALDELIWLPSSPTNPPNESRITSHDPSSLVVVAIWDHMPHMKPSTKRWLADRGVPLVYAHAGERSILEALRDFYPNDQSLSDAPPRGEQ